MEPKSPIASKKKSFLACISCRSKKVKCNILSQFPCASCSKLGLKCVRSTIDKRKERTESEYIKQLERKVKLFEEENLRISTQLDGIATVLKDLSNLKDPIVQEPIKNKDNIPIHDNDNNDNNNSNRNSNDNLIYQHTNNAYVKNTINNNSDGISSLLDQSQSQQTHSSSDNTVNFHERYPTPNDLKKIENKSISVYGPTSVFDSVSLVKSGNSQEMEEIFMLNRNPVIVECIKQFFSWQYPDIHVFIFREAFLLDFYHAKPNSSYCSKELVFAICSIGSLLSENPNIAAKSMDYYEQARAWCFAKYNKPSITLLQSLLVLGLYDIYNGRNDSGWILTGIGMRIGYNIGFQLSPKSWYLDDDPGPKSEFSIEIRSRIFWGTYLVDHLIGLLLGRPSSLKMNDTTMSETIALPDIEWIDEYSFHYKDLKPEILLICDPLISVVKLMDITENMLNDIFNDRQDKTTKNYEIPEKLLLLGKYNLKISQWRNSLPDTVAWNVHDLEIIGSDPTKLTFKLLYYIVVLCLNRPFLNVGGTKQNSNSLLTDSALICETAINDLSVAVRKFTTVHGYSKCSILIIYCCVISISVMLLSHGSTIARSIREKGVFRYKFLLFMATLKSCARIWGLSDKSYKMVKAKLLQDFSVDVDKELEIFDFSQQSHGEIMTAPEQSSDDHTTNFGIRNDVLFGASQPYFGCVEDRNRMEGNNTHDPNPNPLQGFSETNIDNAGDSFGGPPIFMNSTVFSSWEPLFPDYIFDNFNYKS
ncbi:Tea1 protein [Saccharomycopsis crataegensis]|uniref:Tea1 protein n=1 Tax=Saccharomycopsis crataegensis TaxID=43959 RepID=A0AAV5QFQ9_9ASCO|nr:Tea1 protein [Saccharomycopsis crataegensis]